VFLASAKCFETHLISDDHAPSNNQLRDQRVSEAKLKVAPSIEWFKKRMPLYPDYYALL